MIALLLSALIHVEGGFTNSSQPIVLPPAPLGAVSVTIRVDHDTRFRFGYETDGDEITWWTCDSAISSGWQLKAGRNPLLTRRVIQHFAAGGTCLASDGVLDWAGYSGGSMGFLRETSGEVKIPVQLAGNLSLETKARSLWFLSIYWPLVPGYYFGQCIWLNETQWAADVTYSWNFQ